MYTLFTISDLSTYKKGRKKGSKNKKQKKSLMCRN